jgi:hypothetical protein
MMKLSLSLAAFLIGLVAPARADDATPSSKEVREAVEKALPLLQKGAAGHREQRTCFACHSQGLPVLAMTTARSRGIDIDEKELAAQSEFINVFLDRNKKNYLEGRGQGGQADTAGYALWTLEMGGWKPNDTTAAVTEYLLLYKKDQAYWPATSNRPPSEASPFTTTYVALRGLRTFGTAEQKERTEDRVKAAREWLVKTPAKDTEDRVFRLWGLKLAGADADEVKKARQALLKLQRDDGGWAQTSTMEPDAYATGSALVVLHEAGGLAADDPAYRRGMSYLLKTQNKDGTWYVKSRSKPFQTYFETGFPYEKDQFISSAASGWAATALALSLPPAKK